MGTPYSTQSAVGYNASPPPDDGTQVPANKITWAGIKTKLTDVLKTFSESVNSEILAWGDIGTVSVSNTYATVADDHLRVLEATGTFTLSLMDAGTAPNGYTVTVKNKGTGVITIAVVTATNELDGVTNGTRTLSPSQALTFRKGADADSYDEIGGLGSAMPPGAAIDYAGATAPGGFLLCDGSAISRTTYARLFAAIGTTWGAGDTTTTFNLPAQAGRAAIYAGTLSQVETQTSVAAASNAVPVAANVAKWLTGMQVVSTNVSGFGTFTNGTYYVIRIDSTHIKLASSLLNAQNGVASTITGTGTFTITYTGTARTLGEYGGEETHAQVPTEVGPHTHIEPTETGTGDGVTLASSKHGAGTIESFPNTAGAAMNIMQPFMVWNRIIKT